MQEKKEFKNRIIYQIYPLSFKDSNNDGFGDINGIISKLDYLKSLGIGIIWLSPIYSSLMKDNGYDIIDYYEINPLFGTMDDFKNLIAEAKKRDILIVMDLVINHTSSEHKWFKEALKDKNSKYRNYYYFEKGKGKKPPNNWNTSFSGSAWEKVEGEDNMYYLHLYTKEQPDLNYHNEEVIKEVENILKFYLDMGVYGFRCDVINQIYKTSLANGKFRFFNRGKEHYESQPMNHVILRRFYDNVLSKYDSFLVGETSNVTPEIANKFLSNNELDMFFEFDHAFCDMNKIVPIFKKKYKPNKLINSILKWQNEVPWIGNYLENHDQRRSVTRYGDEEKYYKESAKALGLFLLSLRGTPFIFQGQEIGTIDYKNLSLEECDDCMCKYAVETASNLLKISKEKAYSLANKTINRDHARNPMLWDNTINAGFNEGKNTWLKVNDCYEDGINVAFEEKDPDSILNFYKKMIHFRNNSDILKFGDLTRLKANKNIAYFKRSYNGEELFIAVNLSNKEIKFDEENISKILISNKKEHRFTVMQPFEAIIYKR